MPDEPNPSWFKHAVIGSVVGALVGAAIAMVLGAIELSLPGGSGILVGACAGTGAAVGVNIGRAKSRRGPKDD